MDKPIALAIGGHPDDIEFMMAGTLVLLKEAGFETHCMHVGSGSCGSSEQPGPEVAAIRRREAEAAARAMGAVYHPSLVDDLEVFYEIGTLRRMAAIVREVRPSILLVPSPRDYMEDHTNTCRLAVSAAFVRNMRNFEADPPLALIPGDVTVYHAMPHGLRDPLRRRVIPGAFVDITPVFETKMAALAEHHSQQAWLDASQKMDQYLRTMRDFSREVGRMSGRFHYAEGWRRHLHYGFCAEDADPLRDALGKRFLVNRAYERDLEQGSS